MRLSRTARRLVIQNLVVAGAFIAVLVAWDLTGTLPLPLGVAGHEGSTVVVGLNGLRLLREAVWTDSRTAVERSRTGLLDRAQLCSALRHDRPHLSRLGRKHGDGFH